MTPSHELPAIGVEALRGLGDRPVHALPEAVQHLLEQIREDLGVPSVNLIFRVLALEPELLATFWGVASPIVLSPEFDAAARRLRAVSLPRPRSRPLVPPDIRARLAAVVPSTQAVVPRLHLVMAGLAATATGWWHESPSSAGSAGRSRAPGSSRGHGSSGDDLLQRVVATYGHPLPASFLRQLASGPDPILPVVWPWLQPWVGGTAYEAGRDVLISRAVAEADDLGLGRLLPERPMAPVQLSAAELVAVVEVFLRGYAPDVTLTADALSSVTT